MKLSPWHQEFDFLGFSSKAMPTHAGIIKVWPNFLFCWLLNHCCRWYSQFPAKIPKFCTLFSSVILTYSRLQLFRLQNSNFNFQYFDFWQQRDSPVGPAARQSAAALHSGLKSLKAAKNWFTSACCVTSRDFTGFSKECSVGLHIQNSSNCCRHKNHQLILWIFLFSFLEGFWHLA